MPKLEFGRGWVRSHLFSDYYCIGPPDRIVFDGFPVGRAVVSKAEERVLVASFSKLRSIEDFE